MAPCRTVVRYIPERSYVQCDRMAIVRSTRILMRRPQLQCRPPCPPLRQWWWDIAGGAVPTQRRCGTRKAQPPPLRMRVVFWVHRSAFRLVCLNVPDHESTRIVCNVGDGTTYIDPKSIDCGSTTIPPWDVGERWTRCTQTPCVSISSHVPAGFGCGSAWRRCMR